MTRVEQKDIYLFSSRCASTGEKVFLIARYLCSPGTAYKQYFGWYRFKEDYLMKENRGLRI